MSETIKVRITARREEVYTALVAMPKDAYDRHMQSGRIHDKFWQQLIQDNLDNPDFWLDANDFDEFADINVVDTDYPPNIRVTEKDITEIEEDIED